MNALNPSFERSGISKQFLLRTLAGQGIRKFTALLKNAANGFCVNIADKEKGLNIEVSPYKSFLKTMSSKPLFHCNKYVNMDIDQAKDVHTESSEERVERM